MDISILNIELEQLLNTLNLSFSDYIVPFQLTLEQLKSRIKSDKVKWEYSVGAFEKDKLVGFIMHGFDIIDGKRVIYNDGTGVIPERRGAKLTKKMYDFILPTLRKENIDYIVLEVITKNTPALKTYEKIGFEVVRTVTCFKGELNIPESKKIEIKKLTNYDWVKMQSFWDIIPTWQNSKNAIEELKDVNDSYGAFLDNELVGYAIYNPVTKRIQQFATNKYYRRKGVASTLFDYIGKTNGTAQTIINVDSSSVSTNNFLNKIGLNNFIEQYEMKYTLNENK